MKYAESDYLSIDPFQGDESEITLRKVSLKKANKTHICFGLYGQRNHVIHNGDMYRHEKARIDGSFFGEYKICLSCCDAVIEGKA